MEDLLPHYERELALLRRSMQEFAARYPKIAARLAISGEHSDDPHVERMLQSFALLAARIDAKLDDDYPEFAHAMLEALYPQYLRAFPSCSIAQFDTADLFKQLTQPVVLARGRQLITKTGGYRFRTAYDVTLAPLCIEQARYAFAAFAPMTVKLPDDTSGVVSITFAPAAATVRLGASMPAKVRVHLSGQREVVAALTDGLLLRTAAAFVDADDKGQWRPLARSPLTAVGFDEHDALLDGSGDATASFRLLMEYFAFPDKFDFVDVDLGALTRAAGPCERLTLHLAITGVHPDSWAGQRMATLSTDHLKLFCTPVINQFKHDAMPVKLEGTATSFPVVPQAPKQGSIGVYSVDSVRMSSAGRSEPVSVAPFHSLMHGSSEQLSGPYWIARRDPSAIVAEADHEIELTLVGLDGVPMMPDADELAIGLTCTNRNLPSMLAFKTPGGDLSTDHGAVKCPVSLLRRPTESVEPARGKETLWRLISHMMAHPVQLGEAGLDEFKLLFRQFASLSSSQTRHIDGVTRLERRSTMQWIVMDPCPAFVRGIEIALTVDDQAFASSSLNAFIEVMDRFFAPYAPANSFVQLVVISKHNGSEIRRCEPRQGKAALV
ncbi:type VI secretion system baseplate subunit TssF [Trinickia fusca]|uniref:Type VI secretion system baseplate subunit TssF n=1 Tax=Trinickia fusca TaxID=2419777 RepID=A0A494X6G7_9BURK|nr:type VI secretion system baseplate subunit TssF [Trinickia fusca]RKP45221.1 type VI secretion system baseplate subunit TssF [Trinickia fusca]